MSFTNRKRMQNRKSIVLSCSIGLLLTPLGHVPWLATKAQIRP